MKLMSIIINWTGTITGRDRIIEKNNLLASAVRNYTSNLLQRTDHRKPFLKKERGECRVSVYTRNPRRDIERKSEDYVSFSGLYITRNPMRFADNIDWPVNKSFLRACAACVAPLVTWVARALFARSVIQAISF